MKKTMVCLCALLVLLTVSASASALSTGCQHMFVYDREAEELEWVDAEEHGYYTMRYEVCIKCGAQDGKLMSWRYEPHVLSGRTYTGKEYHRGSQHYFQYEGTCVVCGGVGVTWEIVPCSGPPCPLPYSLIF